MGKAAFFFLFFFSREYFIVCRTRVGCAAKSNKTLELGKWFSAVMKTFLSMIASDQGDQMSL
jgi:hypothetical protein